MSPKGGPQAFPFLEKESRISYDADGNIVTPNGVLTCSKDMQLMFKQMMEKHLAAVDAYSRRKQDEVEDVFPEQQIELVMTRMDVVVPFQQRTAFIAKSEKEDPIYWLDSVRKLYGLGSDIYQRKEYVELAESVAAGLIKPRDFLDDVYQMCPSLGRRRLRSDVRNPLAVCSAMGEGCQVVYADPEINSSASANAVDGVAVVKRGATPTSGVLFVDDIESLARAKVKGYTAFATKDESLCVGMNCFKSYWDGWHWCSLTTGRRLLSFDSDRPNDVASSWVPVVKKGFDSGGEIRCKDTVVLEDYIDSVLANGFLVEAERNDVVDYAVGKFLGNPMKVYYRLSAVARYYEKSLACYEGLERLELVHAYMRAIARKFVYDPERRLFINIFAVAGLLLDHTIFSKLFLINVNDSEDLIKSYQRAYDFMNGDEAITDMVRQAAAQDWVEGGSAPPGTSVDDALLDKGQWLHVPFGNLRSVHNEHVSCPRDGVCYDACTHVHGIKQ